MTTERDPVADAWDTWTLEVDDPVRRARRKLIVQIINAQNLVSTWQSYEVALGNMRYTGCAGPAEMQNKIAEAVTFGRRHSWRPAALNAALR